ncbi:MAG: hypothetical protein ACPK85_14015 [Methanosarcina sp.]
MNNATLSVVELESNEVKENNTTMDSPEPVSTPTLTPIPTPTSIPGKLEILTNPEGDSITIEGFKR